MVQKVRDVLHTHTYIINNRLQIWDSYKLGKSLQVDL